jgi:hypothetical protein
LLRVPGKTFNIAPATKNIAYTAIVGVDIPLLPPEGQGLPPQPIIIKATGLPAPTYSRPSTKPSSRPKQPSPASGKPSVRQGSSVRPSSVPSQLSNPVYSLPPTPTTSVPFSTYPSPMTTPIPSAIYVWQPAPQSTSTDTFPAMSTPYNSEYGPAEQQCARSEPIWADDASDCEEYAGTVEPQSEIGGYFQPNIQNPCVHGSTSAATYVTAGNCCAVQIQALVAAVATTSQTAITAIAATTTLR